MAAPLIPPDILRILRSPGTQKPLRYARANEIKASSLAATTADMTTALITEDGEQLFPIQGEIITLTTAS